MCVARHVQSSQNRKLAYFAISPKKCEDEVDFLLADKHQSFVQVDFNTLGIKVYCKVILSSLLDMVKPSQSTQSNKFAISLQYLKKEVRDGVFVIS